MPLGDGGKLKGNFYGKKKKRGKEKGRNICSCHNFKTFFLMNVTLIIYILTTPIWSILIIRKVERTRNVLI